MVADTLADRLAQEYVTKDSLVLDPFCGTGRTLFASLTQGARRVVGIDVNPLALLIARAKGVVLSRSVAERLQLELNRGVDPAVDSCVGVERRRVAWFARNTERELFAIAAAISSAACTPEETIALSAILSATAREVSYCRKDQWKVHRLPPAARSAFHPSAFPAFFRRLERFIQEGETTSGKNDSVSSRASFVLGDARRITETLSTQKLPPKYDLVFSSPPYGDSRTTVQYGGISGICLDIVRHVAGANVGSLRGCDIDRLALGGSDPNRGTWDDSTKELRSYWPGPSESEGGRRVSRFLMDFVASCREMAQVTTSRGRIILVVGNRSVLGFRVRLDQIACDVLDVLGFSVGCRHRFASVSAAEFC
jgi:hypothetical protein